MAEKDKQSSSGSGSSNKRDNDDSSAARYETVTTETGPPEGQQPYPETEKWRPVGVKDVRERVRPADRRAFVGVVNRVDPEADTPKGFFNLDDVDDDDDAQVDGDNVEFAQVLGGNGSTVLILNGKSFNLGPLAGPIGKDLQTAGLYNANT